MEISHSELASGSALQIFAIMIALIASIALGLHAGAPAVGVRSRAAVHLVETAPEKSKQASTAGGDLIPDEPTFGDWVDNLPFAMSKSLARQILMSQTKEPEPLPEIWGWFWDNFPPLAAGKKGEPLTLGDVARTFKINIEQIFGNIPAPDKAPLAAADVEGLDFQAIFLALKTYFDRYGSLYKMCFGPKSFMVVNDPVIARHVLRENPKGYDKGALSLVLEDIMGKGLIPADPITWAKRRRAIAPGFHKLYLERMVSEFGQANANLIPQLLKASKEGTVLDVEERFGSLALDVIGKAVFNYDFGSVNEESPVVKAAIRTLGEVEHRALTPAPYWKLPGANKLIPRLVEFNTDMELLNDVLYKLIDDCLDSRNPEELEALKAKDYSKVKDPSMLRFLIDLRGEEVDNKQMRDDLITLLIAGHETTAAVLTWLTYALSQHPEALKTMQKEIDEVVGDRYPTVDDIKQMPEVQKVIAETLRMWPAPPLFIRCATEADQWPTGGTGLDDIQIARANDLFISTYNLGRSPQLWKDPDVFDPQRWDHPFYNDEVKGWKGYDPERRTPGLWVANLEIATDHAMLPFGAGERKCVGDTFALLEAAVSVVMMFRRFEFDLEMPNGPVYPEKLDPDNPDKSIGMVGMKSAATIHTATGLFCRMKERFPGETDLPPLQDPNLKAPAPDDEPALV